jgi:uncharacterized protein with von Willebrand factor type A (vWA) domain
VHHATDGAVPPLVDLERLHAFVVALRAAGVAVPADALGSYADAMLVVGGDPSGCYWAGRATHVSRREDRTRYDDVFQRFWSQADDPSTDAAVMSSAGAPDAPVADLVPEDDDPPGGVDDEDEERGAVLRASRRELLRTRDFARYTDDELLLARSLMAELRLTTSTRTGRRARAARHGRRRLDLRHTIAAARHTGGEVVTLHHTARRRVPRRVVFLVDVSGSMAAYTRALLQFAQIAGRNAGTKVEVFTMGTRLTRLTRSLRGHDPDEALARAAAAVPDWSGGTRLGMSLRRFNDEWGVAGVARGAVVVIVSDGWERDDPSLLVDELRRLRRVAHRLVWVNPLKASPDYEPLARGMAAALPFLDAFVSGHDLASLSEVAAAVRAGDRMASEGRVAR